MIGKPLSIEESERRYKKNLREKIARLKKRRNAIIIVHNYQKDEIQDIGDLHGDSLALSKAAIETDADVIVFCGVQFMAETAAILNPGKTVLLPVAEAWCPMADMVTVEKLKAKRRELPDAAVVCYVNSSAAVKAESDICCTSSNAVAVVKSLKDKERIIFVPDKNLGLYVQSQIPDKKIILWEGYCPTHVRLQDEEILRAKELYPKARVVAHPECHPEVLALADEVCSTGGMFKYAKRSDVKELIIGTENGILYRLRKENPDKKFISPSERLICPTMKLTTLGWVAHALEANVNVVLVPEETARKARGAIEEMLQITGERTGVAVSGV